MSSEHLPSLVASTRAVLIAVGVAFACHGETNDFRTMAADFVKTPASASLSPSGQFVALQDLSGSVSLLTRSGGSSTLLRASKHAASFEWSQDGRLLTVLEAGVLHGFEIPSGVRRFTLTGSTPLSLPQVSPDGRSVSVIRDHALWLRDADGHFAPAAGDQASSLTGEPDPIFAREFSVPTHYWWSADSSAIAFIETTYAGTNREPLAGEALPHFSLKLIQLPSRKIQILAESSEEWPYLLRVAWLPNGHGVAFYRLNRLQNQAQLCVVENGALRTVFSDKDDYWINPPDTPIFLADGNRVLVTSERSGHRHIYLYGVDGSFIRDLTSNNIEVFHLLVAAQNFAYFTGSSGTLQEQHLFRVSLETGATEQLTQEPGWHEASLSRTGEAYLDSFSTAQQPPSISWHSGESPPQTISQTAHAEGAIASEYTPITTHDGVALPARLFKPADFDPQKRYPLLIYTFSGPRGRVVSDSWGGWQMAWNRYMVRKGYLVLTVDVRGSGGYSHLFEEYIHYRFGAQETVDLREVVAFLRTKPYVDPQRLGIWGCDYGAHTAVHAMLEFPNGFKAGFADAPVTDWHKYNAYFAERYLGLPQKRPREYDDSSPLENAKRMTGDLLIAGLPDDPQRQALEEAMKEVKPAAVALRFHVLSPRNRDYRTDAGEFAELLEAMTKFFDSKL